MNRRIFGFERNIFFLSLVSFFTDFSSEIIYPLLPIFLTSVLGAGTAFVGLVEGVAETTASMLKLFSGWFSDRIKKRKPLVVFGYCLSSVTRPLVSIATAPWNVLCIRFLDRVGKGVRNSPRDALIADSCPPQEKGRSFGFNRAMDNAGAMAGSLAVFILLLGVTKNYRLIFALASIPAACAVVVVLFFIRDRPPSVRLIGEKRPEGTPLHFSKKFKFFMFSVLIFTLGNSSDAFLLLRAKEMGVGIAFIPLLWFTLNFVKTFTATPLGIISDKVGRKRVIIIGWIIYSIVYFGFAHARAQYQIWLLFSAYGLFYGFTEGVERALVADLVPEDARGRAFGTYNFIIGISALPASLLMGVLWQVMGSGVAFSFGAAMALVASCIFAVLLK